MSQFLSPNDIAAQVSLAHIYSPQGASPPCRALPTELANVARYIAQECQVSLGWAISATLASIGIAAQGRVRVHIGQAFEVPLLPAFLLLGERGSGKDRTLKLALRPIHKWELQTGSSILSARRSYVQQMRQCFENGGFSAIVDGEFDSLADLFSHPDHRGEILDQLEGTGKGYVSQRNAYAMTNAGMAFVCGAQPSILQKKVLRYSMEENGFLSRCCMVNASYQARSWEKISSNSFDDFAERILTILNKGSDLLNHHEYRTLTLTPEAFSVLQGIEWDFRGWAHPRRNLLEGWLARAVAHTTKIAAILSLYEDPLVHVISTEAVYRAAELGKWLLEETRIAYDYLFPMPGVHAALIIGRYLQQIQAVFVSDRQLKLALAKDITSPREIKAGISLLISICALQPGSSADGRRGRPESGYQVDVPRLMDFLGC